MAVSYSLAKESNEKNTKPCAKTNEHSSHFDCCARGSSVTLIKIMNTNEVQLWALGSVMAGCFVTIFWMVVGWRAMRAHEKISDYLSEDLEQKSLLLRATKKTDRNGEGKSFRDFLEANPIAKHLDATEQMRRFTEWKNDQK